MMYQLQFKQHFRWTSLPGEGVVLQAEHGHVVLRNPVYERLAPLLDGQLTGDEIIARLQDQIPAIEARYALEVLRHHGLVVENLPSIPPGQAAFWDVLNIDRQTVAASLQDRFISVISLGNIDPAPFTSLLAQLGLRVGSSGKQCVVLADDYLNDELMAFNAEALRQQRSWLLVKPTGTDLWIGPLFLPQKTGCWACLAHRLRGTRKIDSYLLEKTGATRLPPLPAATLPSTITTALSIAATETARWLLCGQQENLEGKIVTLNLLSMDKQIHLLTKRPQCPQCGDPSAFSVRQSFPLVLQGRRKRAIHDGGPRSLTAEETFTTLAHHVSPLTGIVGSLRMLLPEMDAGSLAFSVVATQNFLHSPQEDSLSLDSLNATLLSGSGGKGRCATQAKVSALCEAIERYSGTFQGDEFRIRARYQDFAGAAILPNDCMLYSERQLTQRGWLNASGSRSTWAPEPFDPQSEIEWSPAWSLTANEPRYLPTAYCYYGYSRMHKTWFARADSNGCAAGWSKEEAILQGFMELVERDGIALWWYNCLRKPQVDLCSFAEPYFQELQTYYQSLHRDLWVLELTSDLAIPTFAAISRRNDMKVEAITCGFGAHFDARLAIQHALTELNQWLPVVHSRAVEQSGNFPSLHHEALQWWKTATLANQPYLAPDESIDSKKQEDYTTEQTTDLAVDVMTCVKIAKTKGLETLILDQSRADTGLTVVKVVVPGLRHFWPRFGPGRLYKVPFQMDWLKEPLTEEQLNPQHIFF